MLLFSPSGPKTSSKIPLRVSSWRNWKIVWVPAFSSVISSADVPTSLKRVANMKFLPAILSKTNPVERCIVTNSLAQRKMFRSFVTAVIWFPLPPTRLNMALSFIFKLLSLSVCACGFAPSSPAIIRGGNTPPPPRSRRDLAPRRP